MSTWFSAAAVAVSLVQDWHLTPAQLGSLTVAVQLGFVTGGLASAVTGVADLVLHVSCSSLSDSLIC